MRYFLLTHLLALVSATIFSVSANASPAVCGSLAQKAIEEFPAFGEHETRLGSGRTPYTQINYPDYQLGNLTISFVDLSPALDKQRLEGVSSILFKSAPYGKPRDGVEVQLRNPGIADPEQGVSHMSIEAINQSNLVVISDWRAVRTCAVEILIISPEGREDAEAAIVSISEALQRPPEALDSSGPGPITDLEHTCIANPTPDCINKVTVELVNRGRVANSTWASVSAILRGIDETEHDLRTQGLEEIEFRRTAAVAAIAAGDAPRAFEHLEIGWPEPKGDHVEDVRRFHVIMSAVEQALLVDNDERSYRRALRAVFSNYPVNSETGRILAMPDLHRILLMTVFATSPKAPAGAAGNLWPDDGWEDNSRSHQAYALYILSDIDPASETDTIEARFAEVNPAFHDFLRSKLSHRLFLSGETQKATYFAQQIGDPVRRNFILIEGLRTLGSQLNSAAVEDSLDELGEWASKDDANPFFVLEYRLLQERFEKSGRRLEVDNAIKRCIAGNGWSNSVRPVEMLVENGRLGDAITLALYYPRPGAAATSIAKTLVKPVTP